MRRPNRGCRDYTTGEVAALCGVAPRTVAKWFDGGRLKGFRIPDSRDRRIPPDDLLEFLDAAGMARAAAAVRSESRPAVLLVGCPAGLGEILSAAPGVSVIEAADLYAAGRASVAAPRVLVVDFGAVGGPAAGGVVAAALDGDDPPRAAVALLGADTDQRHAARAAVVFHYPPDLAAVAAEVTRLAARASAADQHARPSSYSRAAAGAEA